jgi:hypothetical protein
MTTASGWIARWQNPGNLVAVSPTMRQTSPKGEMRHAAHAMTQFADETEEDEVASALEPFAESSDSTHWARALLLRGEAEKVGEVIRDHRKGNYEELLVWCSRYALSHRSRCVMIR